MGLLQFYKIELPDLFVVVDDVNLELGRLRARAAGSAGGHNGLKSIIGALGSEEFARVRVGVGGGEPRRDLADHVLGRFAPEERPIIAEAVGRSADAAELFVTEGIAPVMNRFNRKEDEGREGRRGIDNPHLLLATRAASRQHRGELELATELTRQPGSRSVQKETHEHEPDSTSSSTS